MAHDKSIDWANRVDIGDDHALVFVGYKGEPRVGANVIHKTPDGAECVGFISFTGRGWSNLFKDRPGFQSWEVLQDEPLTLSPSIACRGCGDHGYIRDGKWVRA